MNTKVSNRIRAAHEELNAAYESEKKGRAKRAWGNGVLWVLLMLEKGDSFDSIATKALELDVDLSHLQWRPTIPEE